MLPPDPPCCRACLTTNDKSLYSLCDPIDDTTYLECFKQIAGCGQDVAALVALGQTAPDTICEQCFRVLQLAYAFRKRCRQSAQEFLQRWQKRCEPVWLIDDEVNGDKSLGDADTVILKETIKEEEQSTCPEEFVPRSDDEEVELIEDYLDAHSSIEEFYLDKIDEVPKESSEAPLISLKCLTCELIFDSRLTYNSHMQSTHGVGWTHLCSDCGILCVSALALSRHKLGHTPISDRPYQCDICGKSFMTRIGIVQHMDLHKGLKKGIPCPECGKCLNTKRGLELHSRLHSGQRNFACENCDKTFTNKAFLSHHRRKVHIGDLPFRYHCRECSLQFSALNSLKSHMRVHTGERPFKCNMCAKTFASNSALRYHMPTHIGGTLPCPKCDKKFGRPLYLRQHMLTHSGWNPFKCAHCTRSFKQKRQLERHLDARHLDLEHVCTECGQVFAKMAALKQHVRTHDGGRQLAMALVVPLEAGSES